MGIPENKVLIEIKIVNSDEDDRIRTFVDRDKWSGYTDDEKIEYLNIVAESYYVQKRHS